MFNKFKSEIYLLKKVILIDLFEPTLNLCDNPSYTIYQYYPNSESNLGVETWEADRRKKIACLNGVCFCDANIYLIKVLGVLAQK